MTKKEQILKFYYEENLNTIDISNSLNVTKQYVSKITKMDSRYYTEKERRKRLNRKKHKQQINECVKKNKKRKRNERLDGYMELLHKQAACELSSGRNINNKAFRNWNSSIYQYYSRTKEYRLKNDYKNKVSYAVPKRIKWN